MANFTPCNCWWRIWRPLSRCFLVYSLAERFPRINEKIILAFLQQLTRVWLVKLGCLWFRLQAVGVPVPPTIQIVAPETTKLYLSFQIRLMYLYFFHQTVDIWGGCYLEFSLPESASCVSLASEKCPRQSGSWWNKTRTADTDWTLQRDLIGCKVMCLGANVTGVFMALVDFSSNGLKFYST